MSLRLAPQAGLQTQGFAPDVVSRTACEPIEHAIDLPGMLPGQRFRSWFEHQHPARSIQGSFNPFPPREEDRRCCISKYAKDGGDQYRSSPLLPGRFLYKEHSDFGPQQSVAPPSFDREELDATTSIFPGVMVEFPKCHIRISRHIVTMSSLAGGDRDTRHVMHHQDFPCSPAKTGHAVLQQW